MAGITGSRQACVSNILLAMAIMTAGLRMCSRKGKLGLPAMIERSLLPVIRRMTALARRGQAAIMCVICLMAINAFY